MKLASVAILAATLALPRLAAAQSAEAEALFRDGKALIKSGKLDTGCDKIEASEKLESSVGTLLNLGDCREKQGRVASAWAAFRKAEADAKRAGDDTKRMTEAKRRADKLEQKLVRLVIQVDKRIDGLVIKRDGEVVDAAVWGSAVPVDPDTYKIVAEAPGYIAWRTEVNVDSKIKRRVVAVPQLAKAPVTAQPVATQPSVPAPATAVAQSPADPVAQPLAQPQPAPLREPDRSAWTGTRKFSAVLAVAGVAAVGTGIYFGIHARDLSDRSDERCPLPICTDAEGLRLNNQAQDAALTANILYAAGGVSIATAAVLWVVGAPSEHTMIAPSVGSDHAGVSYQRSF